MGKSCDYSSSIILDLFFILAGNTDNHKISNGSKFGRIQAGTYELSALERMENSL